MRLTWQRNLVLTGLVIVLVLLSVIWGSAKKNYRVVCDIWPPYQMYSGTQVSGFSTDVVREVFRRMDVGFEEISAYPWKRALSMVETGHADALFSANYTEDRDFFAYYPKEVIVESPWLLWIRDDSPIRSMDDLKGKRVGVVLGYSYTREFWKFIETYCIVERVSTDEINFRKLELGRLDAIAAEYGNGLYLMRQLGVKNIRPHPELEIKRDGLYIIFNRNSVSEYFVNSFSDELKRFRESPEYEALRGRYLGESAGQ